MMKTYKHILIATDFHDHGLQVIDQAISLQKENKSKLSIVNVLPKIPYYMSSGVPSISNLENQIEENNLIKLKALESKIHCKANYHLLHGSPKREIVKIAQKIDADLIVIGSHGRHGVERFIGSTANGVIQRAHCDVLIVRMKA